MQHEKTKGAKTDADAIRSSVEPSDLLCSRFVVKAEPNNDSSFTSSNAKKRQMKEQNSKQENMR